MDVAFGFVFVALAGDPPPVARTWGTLADEFAPYRFEEMVPLAPITTETWNVDWKIAMDNYLESYHVPIGHPGLYRMFTPDYDDQVGVPGVARGVSWLREQPSPRWAERMYQQLVGQVSQHLPEANRRCWRFYSMLPNLGIDVFPEQMDFFQVLPAGPGKCTIRGGNVWPAGLQPRDARRALPGPADQPARSTARTNGCARACSADWRRAVTRRVRCRSSSAGCASSTTCCANASRRPGRHGRRHDSLEPDRGSDLRIEQHAQEVGHGRRRRHAGVRPVVRIGLALLRRRGERQLALELRSRPGARVSVA